MTLHRDFLIFHFKIMDFAKTEQLALDFQMALAELNLLSVDDAAFNRNDVFADLVERHDRVRELFIEPGYTISIIRELEENAGNDLGRLKELFRVWQNKIDKIQMPKDSSLSSWLDGDDRHLKAFQIAKDLEIYFEMMNDAVTAFRVEYGIDDCGDWEQQEEQHDNTDTDNIAVEQPEPQQFTLPKELDNDEAKRYFNKAIELGLMENGYKWLKGLQMLACFAREMSLRLELSNAQNSDGTKRISWKPFEHLFKIGSGKLRANYQDIKKTGDEPNDVYLIDKVFEQ